VVRRQSASRHRVPTRQHLTAWGTLNRLRVTGTSARLSDSGFSRVITSPEVSRADLSTRTGDGIVIHRIRQQSGAEVCLTVSQEQCHYQFP
jgi:hypothetical protein